MVSLRFSLHCGTQGLRFRSPWCTSWSMAECSPTSALRAFVGKDALSLRGSVLMFIAVECLSSSSSSECLTFRRCHRDGSPQRNLCIRTV